MFGLGHHCISKLLHLRELVNWDDDSFRSTSLPLVHPYTRVLEVIRDVESVTVWMFAGFLEALPNKGEVCFAAVG